MKKVVKNIFSLVIVPVLIALFMCIVIGNDFSYFFIALLVACAVYYPLKFGLKATKNKSFDSSEDYKNYTPSNTETNYQNNKKSEDEQFFEDVFLYGMFDDDE